VKTDFYEVTDMRGRKNIVFECASCKTTHVTPSPQGSRLRRLYHDCDIFILWCGNGNIPPYPSSEDEVICVQTPKPYKDQRTEKQIKKAVDELLTNAGIVAFISETVFDAIKILENQKTVLEYKEKQLVQSKENIDNAIRKIKEEM